MLFCGTLPVTGAVTDRLQDGMIVVSVSLLLLAVPLLERNVAFMVPAEDSVIAAELAACTFAALAVTAVLVAVTAMLVAVTVDVPDVPEAEDVPELPEELDTSVFSDT